MYSSQKSKHTIGSFWGCNWSWTNGATLLSIFKMIHQLNKLNAAIFQTSANPIMNLYQIGRSNQCPDRHICNTFVAIVFSNHVLGIVSAYIWVWLQLLTLFRRRYMPFGTRDQLMHNDLFAVCPSSTLLGSQTWKFWASKSAKNCSGSIKCNIGLLKSILAFDGVNFLAWKTNSVTRNSMLDEQNYIVLLHVRAGDATATPHISTPSKFCANFLRTCWLLYLQIRTCVLPLKIPNYTISFLQSSSAHHNSFNSSLRIFRLLQSAERYAARQKCVSVPASWDISVELVDCSQPRCKFFQSWVATWGRMGGGWWIKE